MTKETNHEVFGTEIIDYKYNQLGWKVLELYVDLKEFRRSKVRTYNKQTRFYSNIWGVTDSTITYELCRNILQEGDGFSGLKKTINTFSYDHFNNIIAEKRQTLKSKGLSEFSSCLSISLNDNFERNYVYTFDSQNNWISKIEFERNEPKMITERKIVYYD
jgi:hypothetical protein